MELLGHTMDIFAMLGGDADKGDSTPDAELPTEPIIEQQPEVLEILPFSGPATEMVNGFRKTTNGAGRIAWEKTHHDVVWQTTSCASH